MTDLRAIAEAATTGPWWHARSIGYRAVATLHPLPGGGFKPPRLVPADGCQGEADAAHIAAWHPGRAIAALTVIEAAREVAGFDAAFNADGSDRWPALRAALARWEALA